MMRAVLTGIRRLHTVSRQTQQPCSRYSTKSTSNSAPPTPATGTPPTPNAAPVPEAGAGHVVRGKGRRVRSKQKHRRRVLTQVAGATALGSVVGGLLVGGNSYWPHASGNPDKGKNRKNVWSPTDWVVNGGKGCYYCVADKFNETYEGFVKPSKKVLLPPFPPEWGQGPRTLVVSLEDTLVDSIWDRSKGWRVVKRPGAEMFLTHLAQFYEIVIFSKENFSFGDPILNKLDPNGYISHRLFRDSTLYVDGKHFKDLSCLGRDLSRVVVIDPDEEATMLNKENCVPIKKWKTGSTDNTLVALIPFLEQCARDDVQDMREELSRYSGMDIPTQFFQAQEDRARKLEKFGVGGLRKLTQRGKEIKRMDDKTPATQQLNGSQQSSGKKSIWTRMREKQKEEENEQKMKEMERQQRAMEEAYAKQAAENARK